jgi:hypothetical protein
VAVILVEVLERLALTPEEIDWTRVLPLKAADIEALDSRQLLPPFPKDRRWGPYACKEEVRVIEEESMLELSCTQIRCGSFMCSVHGKSELRKALISSW